MKRDTFLRKKCPRLIRNSAYVLCFFVFQMGGDFIFNHRGTLLYVYNSPTAHDRPSMDMLLDVCKVNVTECTRLLKINNHNAAN